MTVPAPMWQNDYDRLDRAIDRMRAALENVGAHFKTSGGGSNTHIQASCPLHKDVDPSLSIDDHGDGRVVMCCHSAGCTEDDLIAALGLRDDQLWDRQARPCPVCGRRSLEPGSRGDYTHGHCAGDGRPSRTRRPRADSRRADPPRLGPLPKRVTSDEPETAYTVVVRRRQTDRYDHVTIDGEVVAASVRDEEVRRYAGEDAPRTVKWFYQEYADGAGGWVRRKPEGLVVPLWRAPELAGSIAAGKPVWLAEGHKDARSLLAAGVEEATTNIAGAGGFSADDAEQLRGAQVRVVCDRDHAGYGRGLKVAALLDGVATAVQVLLPKPTEAKVDATDHLQAGHGLQEFVPVGVEELQALQLTAQVLGRVGVPDLDPVPREVQVQLDLAATAAEKAPKKAEEHQRKAKRWADQGGQILLKLDAQHQRLLALPGQTAEQLAVAAEVLAEVREVVAAAYGACGIEPSDPVAEALARDPLDGGRVLDPRPAQWSRLPANEFTMMRGKWRYDLGENCDRGVYNWQEGTESVPGRWRWMAPMPHVQNRVIRRDGQGSRCGTDYLLAAGEGDKPVIVTTLALRDGTWANDLGLDLSYDDKIIRAAATAIVHHATRAVPEREATPRLDSTTGKITVPAPDALPPGYLRCAPGTRDQALTVWAEIIRTAAASPKLALVLGASAAAPYLSALRLQSHFVALYGDSSQGKSVALRLAGGVWGDSVSREDGGGVVSHWNASGIGATRYAGMLGVLPPIFDEAGMAKWSTPAEWGRVIYDLCEGAQRLTAETRGPGVRVTKPWYGILISAGNARLTDGLGAGQFAGVKRRVIDLATPICTSASQARQLDKQLLPVAYGHAGAAILDQVTVAEVQALVDEAADDIGRPETGSAQTIAESLHTHIAGAALLDRVAGTGTLLRDAAVEAAVDHLDQWTEPEHDADRMMSEIRDWMGREPAKWPTVSQYLEMKQPRTHDTPAFGGRTVLAEIPQHQVDREEAGLCADDGTWVAVFKKSWKTMAAEHGLDHSVVCAELHKRGLLYVTDSQRRKGEWSNRAVRGQPGLGDMYKLLIPVVAPDDDLEEGGPQEGGPQEGGGCGPDGSQFEAAGSPSTPTDPPVEAMVDPLPDPPEPEASTAAPESFPGSSSVPEPSADPPNGPGRGEPGWCTGSGRGGVRGANVALTRGVRGVRGETDEITRTPARGDSQALDQQPVDLDPGRSTGTWQSRDGGQHQRGWALRIGPCEVCSRPCLVVIDGHRIHFPCLERHLEDLSIDPSPAVSAEDASIIDDRQARGGASPGDTGGIAQQPGKPDRFAAPAAVLDAGHVHVPGQPPQPWQAGHLGHLALLTAPDQLRLGWGGGEDRFPDEGQVWLDAGALERLGLPATVELPEQVASSDQARRSAITKAFAPLLKLPAVADALAEGWQLGRHGLDAWTRIWHPDLLPRGAWLVAIPWERVDDVPLLEGLDGPEPARQLADRLAAWAAAVDVSYRLSPASTGVDLIDHTRPPRRSHDDDLGAARHRRALVRGEAAELPDFLRRARDDRFRTVEADFSWWRPWTSLLASERDKPFVALYDRGKSYLTPWSNIELGLEGLTHRTGAAASWDGSEKPGYYLVDRWTWDAWWLPDPAQTGAVSAFVDHNRVWVTSHTLRQLKTQGVEPAVHEAYTWQVSSRYLEVASQRIRAALDTAAGDPAVEATIKALYSSTVGKLGERDHRPDYHLWRPDWRHHIIANTRTAILHTLRKIHDTSGAAALVVDRDAIAFAVDDPDPWRAWPGSPDKLGTRVGQWKPIGVAPLAEWGPAHLPTPTRAGQRWRYADAVDATTLPDRQ